MIDIIITNHANERIKERVGLKSQHAKEAYVMKAYYEGLREKDCSGASLKLIQRRKRDEFTDRDLVLYRDQIFVFDGHSLVTVLPVDYDYLKIMNKVRCKRNRKIA